MFEDFENIEAKEQALIHADMLEEFYKEMDEDLQDPIVQRAFGIHPDQRRAAIEEQDLDFEISHKAA